MSRSYEKMLALKSSDSNSQSANSQSIQQPVKVKDIQWFMLDKRKYFPYTVINMFAVRTVLYPLTLVRTRLQVQTRQSIYTGTLNALNTIIKYEGLSGLYKGYLVNSLQCLPHVLYITTYEKVRQQVSAFTTNIYTMAFIGGAAGSIVGQMFSVPLDIVSQHMMLVDQKSGVTTAVTKSANPSTSRTYTSSLSAPIHSTHLKQKVNLNDLAINAKRIADIERIHVPHEIRQLSTISITKYIMREIYKNERLTGFYRGYFLSTFLVSLNSGLWWPFYYFYQGLLTPVFPKDFPTLALQCCCGPLSSLSASFISNPIDVMRTRMQVTKTRESAVQVLKILWEQDSYRLFWKGLTARLSYSCFYSFFIICGYETVKKYSLKEEYQQILYPIE